MKWPQARAALIAIVIAFGLVDGCPLPERADDAPSGLRWLVEPAREAQRIAEWPVVWIRRVLRVSQRWALYQAPGGERYRMSIVGAGTSGEVLLYRAADPDHTEDADVIEHSRMWGVWDPTDRPPSQFRSFARWIAERMLDRHPELDAVGIHFEKITIVRGGWESSGQFVLPFMQGRKR